MTTPVLFVDPNVVGERMQLNVDLDGVLDVLTNALNGAQLHIEAVMQTKLNRSSQDSLFFLDKDAYSGMQPGGRFKIEVPSYFIRTDTPVVLQSAGAWNDGNPTVIDNSTVKIDYEKGQIFLDACTYADRYIRVQCDTGFDPTDTIPDWLYEAILSYCGPIMDVGQTTNRAAQAMDIYKRAGDHAVAVLTPNLRKRGFVFREV